ncbi:hypothetical protein [Sphingomonas fuzhouensis]|uniref:hypothetical protein n=1 Tax=Sphingomonas fuzhouensis TaxID=3106033 RepID=UPI002AFE6F40|nr:hypothetical protein [Sphingomonas sp. SGZ-02]
MNKPHRIEAFGFAQVDEVAHMISWLGRGGNFRQFVTNDVEGELYAQTPGAQLLSITCKGPLHLETRVMPKGQGATPIDISVTFPLSLQIKMPDDALWRLDVEHNYDAVNIHLKDGRRTLTQNFSVVGHEQVS